LAPDTATAPDNYEMRAPMTRLLSLAKNNAIALTALFVAIGGTSYAAINLPANSVGTKQIRNGSVTANKLDPNSIAGHIAFWAQIRADGHVISSSPHATVVPFAVSGLERVSWHQAVSPRCVALADPTNVAPITATAAAYASGPFGGGRDAYFVVSMSDGRGNNVSQNVNIVVVCP
jgi:hypothetical protein